MATMYRGGPLLRRRPPAPAHTGIAPVIAEPDSDEKRTRWSAFPMRGVVAISFPCPACAATPPVVRRMCLGYVKRTLQQFARQVCFRGCCGGEGNPRRLEDRVQVPTSYLGVTADAANRGGSFVVQKTRSTAGQGH
jgi:hypothetical protein